MKNRNTNQKLGNIRRAAAFLRKALLAYDEDVTIGISINRKDKDVSLVFHRVKSNFDATNIMRDLNINKREKRVFGEGNPWHTLTGDNEELNAIVYADGLPATCKIVEVTERIPKTNIVESTIEGEFIEVKRFKTVCG